MVTLILPPRCSPCGPFGSPLGPRLRHFVFLESLSFAYHIFIHKKRGRARGALGAGRAGVCVRRGPRAGWRAGASSRVPQRVRVCVHAPVGPGQAPRGVGQLRGRIRGVCSGGGRDRAGQYGAGQCVCVCVLVCARVYVCARACVCVRACTVVRARPRGSESNKARGASP